MADDPWYDQLVAFLRSRGYIDAEIEKIIARVKQYDLQTRHDSIMDSIDSGEFDLDAIIKEALDGSD